MKKPRQLTYDRAFDYYMTDFLLSKEVDQVSRQVMMQEVDLRARVAVAAHKCRCFRCMGDDEAWDPMGKTWGQWVLFFRRPILPYVHCPTMDAMKHRENVLGHLQRGGVDM